MELEVIEEEEARGKVMKEDCFREKPHDNTLDKVVGNAKNGAFFIAVEDAFYLEELCITGPLWDEELLAHE